MRPIYCIACVLLGACDPGAVPVLPEGQNVTNADSEREDTQSEVQAPVVVREDVTIASDDDVPPEELPPAPAPVPAPPPPFYPASCLALHQARPELKSGYHSIFISSATLPRKEISASCDMETDGGGWTLVVNYNHLANTNPPLTIRKDNLPLLGRDVLGIDESTLPMFWGQAGTPVLAMLAPIKELRFYCRSSENTRVMHFKTSEANCLSAVRSGKGSCLGLKQNFTTLAGHTSVLPGTMDIAELDQAEEVLTNNTFGRIEANGPDRMWSIRGETDAVAWECDFGSNNSNFNTIHRIWMR